MKKANVAELAANQLESGREQTKLFPDSVDLFAAANSLIQSNCNFILALTRNEVSLMN